MESPTHNLLKRLSVEWLRAQGYRAAACEVRSPIAQWVLDVAGWRDAWWDSQSEQRIRLDSPQTAIIECKQSRADFLRDSRRFDALIQLRQRYEGIRRSIEEHRIKALEPQLRQSGSSLFPELEEWDFEASELPSYRKTLARLEQIDARLHGETKFFRISQYGLADALFVAAPAGMIAVRELPHGWGLLELDEDESLKLRRDSTATAARPRHRLRMLRNIAIAASAQLARSTVPNSRENRSISPNSISPEEDL